MSAADGAPVPPAAPLVADLLGAALLNTSRGRLTMVLVSSSTVLWPRPSSVSTPKLLRVVVVHLKLG